MVLNKNSYFRSLMLIVMITSLLTPYSVLAQTNTEEKKLIITTKVKILQKEIIQEKEQCLSVLQVGLFIIL